MNPLRLAHALGAFAIASSCGGAQPAHVTVRNDFANAQFTLVDVAYQGNRWKTAIGMGKQSPAADVTAGLDYAYALAVWAYDANANPAQKPLVIRTKDKVESIAGTSSNVVFSEATHTGKCGGLSKPDYESIVSTHFASATVQAYDDIACN